MSSLFLYFCVCTILYILTVYVEVKEEGKPKLIDFLRIAFWSYMPFMNVVWLIGTIIYMALHVVEVTFLNHERRDK